jgi:hypothetical protein
LQGFKSILKMLSGGGFGIRDVIRGSILTARRDLETRYVHAPPALPASSRGVVEYGGASRTGKLGCSVR